MAIWPTIVDDLTRLNKALFDAIKAYIDNLITVQGVPPGGATNDILKKASATDYDDAWTDAPTLDSVTLDTAAAEATGIAKIYWDATEGTVAFGMAGGVVTLQVGRHEFVRCKNTTASQINRGQVVYLTGAQGDRPTIALADATDESTSADTIGVAAEDIPVSAEGEVCISGILANVNTYGLTAGVMTYLSETPGAWTQTRPTQPAHGVRVGIPLKISNSPSGNSGVFYVQINNGYEFEELHDVLITTATAGDIIKRNAGNTLWVNAAPAALTKTDDTNVTLTLGGSPTTALVNAASITAGWTGQLAVGRGGTGASTLTGYVYGNGTSAMTASTTIPGSAITGNISGNAGTATTLQTARNLWGNSFNGSADVTGAIQLQAGAVGTPSLTASGDLNTGVYFPAADTVSVTTGGTERVRITSGGQALFGTLDSSLYFTNAGADISTYYRLKYTGGNNATNAGVAFGNDVNTNAVGFWINNSASKAVIGARLTAAWDNTVAGSEAAYLDFMTQASGAAAATRLRITSAGHVQPGANDGGQLGVSGTAWSDLFLASGGVINWNAGDATLTHSSGLLTVARGSGSMSFTVTAVTSGQAIINVTAGDGKNTRILNNGAQVVCDNTTDYGFLYRVSSSQGSYGWQTGASNTMRMVLDQGGTLILGSGDNTATPTGNTFRATSGLGTDIIGANLTIAAGNGTGTGGSGYIAFQTAPASTTGTNWNAMTERVRIGANGRTVITGTSAQEYPLQITNSTFTSGAIAYFTNTSGSFYIGTDGSTGNTTGTAYARHLWANGAYPMVFATNNIERLRITSGGDLAIGATAKLYLDGTAASGNTYLTESAADTISVFTGGTERVRVTSNGNVGINTSSVVSAASRIGMVLRGNANGAEFIVQSTSASDTTSDGLALIASGVDGSLYNRLNGILAFATNNTERVRITSAGDVVVNNTAALFTAASRGNITINGTDAVLAFGNSASGSGYIYSAPSFLEIAAAGSRYLMLVINGSERVRLDSSGNLLVGTNTGSLSTLTVATSDGGAPVNTTGKNALRLRSTATAAVGAGPSILFEGQTGNTTTQYAFAAIQGLKESAAVNNYSGSLSFFTQNSGGATSLAEWLRLTSAGALILGSGEGTATPTGNTFRGPNATGTDIAGANLTIAAGNGTGTGGSGYIAFQTAAASTTGSAANSLTERMRIHQSGFTQFTSNIDEIARFRSDSTGPYVSFYEGGTRRGYFFWSSVHAILNIQSNIPLLFYTNGSERLRITNDGNLAIGATAKLYLDGVGATGNTYITESAADTISFFTNGAERLTLSSGGNVGIGTNAPVAILDIAPSSGAPQLHIRGQSSSDVYVKTVTTQGSFGFGTGIGSVTNSFHIYDFTAGVSRLVINSTGTVGIGVTPSAWTQTAVQIARAGLMGNSTQGTLTVNSYFNAGWKYVATGAAASYYEQSSGGHKWVNAPSGTADAAVTFTDRMQLDVNGNLAVGATAKFYLDGTAATGDTYLVESASNTLDLVAGGTIFRHTTTALGLATNDAASLGTGTVSWSDLFLASGALISFANGAVTLTHSANALTFAGATSGYTFSGGNIIGTLQGNATNVTGTVAIANGGSGTTTAQGAMNAFAGAVTSGSYLRGNGTNVVMSTIQAGDVPTLNQNTTGSAATLTTARTLTIGNTGKTFNGSADVSWTANEFAIPVFNNMGEIHGTRTSFDASTASYNFGFRYVQGSGNGPGTGGSQYYSLYIGLGSEYPATGAASHGMYMAIDRNVTTPYLSIRYNENNSLGTWRRICAGQADILTTARNINGTSFNGSANITTASWGTARTLTIGNTGKSVDGSANVSWSIAEIGALALTGGTLTGSITTTGAADLAQTSGIVRITTGSIASTDAATRGLVLDGNYTNGQYRHRWRKFDDGLGLPLYLDYAHATANSFTQIARFGGGGTYREFDVFGSQGITGNLFVSTGNTTGGGLILADDGDIVDLNDGYCAMRFSNGVRVHTGNRTGSAIITLSSGGTVTATTGYFGPSTGRMFIGDVGHGVTYPALAHQDYATTTGYAFLAGSNGYTFINKRSAAGSVIGFRKDNNDMMVLTNDGHLAIAATARLYLDGIAASGNTYIHENSADLIHVVAGGSAYGFATGAFGPITDNARSDGAASNRWTAVYAVNGTIQTSDRTRKRDITPTPLGLDFVRQLQPIEFSYTDEAPIQRRQGLIAQEVLALVDRRHLNGIITGDKEGEYGINYAGLVPALIAAIQAQDARIAALEAQR